jgi:hypothetical protein
MVTTLTMVFKLAEQARHKWWKNDPISLFVLKNATCQIADN